MNRCEECGGLSTKPRLEAPWGRWVCEECFQEMSSGLAPPPKNAHPVMEFDPTIWEEAGKALNESRLKEGELVAVTLVKPDGTTPFPEFSFRAEILPIYPTQGPDGKSCLTLAKEAVDDRAGRYGNPLDNHTHTAALWSAFLRARGWTNACEKDLTPEDVCWLNVLQKASRDAFTPYLDNLTDGCGYLRNVEVIRAMRAEREKKGE